MHTHNVSGEEMLLVPVPHATRNVSLATFPSSHRVLKGRCTCGIAATLVVFDVAVGVATSAVAVAEAVLGVWAVLVVANTAL